MSTTEPEYLPVVLECSLRGKFDPVRLKDGFWARGITDDALLEVKDGKTISSSGCQFLFKCISHTNEPP